MDATPPIVGSHITLTANVYCGEGRLLDVSDTEQAEILTE